MRAGKEPLVIICAQMRVLAGLVLGMLLLLPPTAGADEQSFLKKNVFSDCPAAVAEATALTEQGKREFIDYLLRVLRLEAPSGKAVFVPEQRISVPLDDLRGPEAWRSFEPQRELDGKRCALRIIEAYVPLSADVVPALIDIARTQKRPPELLDAVEKTSFRLIARSQEDANFEASEELLKEITAFVGGEEGVLAENILFELQKSSVPYLIRRLKDSDPSVCDAVCRALLTMDPDGSAIGAPLVELMKSGDKNLLLKVVGTVARLPVTYAESLPAMIEEYNSTDNGLIKEGIKFALLDVLQNPGAVEKLSISDKTLDGLITALQNSLETERDIFERLLRLTILKKPEYYAPVLQLLKNPDRDLHARALRILAGGTESPNLLEACLALLSTPSSDTETLNAITVLSGFDGRAAKVLGAYEKYLKGISTQNEPKRREESILAVIEGVEALGSVKGRAPFLPLAIESLSIERSLPKEIYHPAGTSLKNDLWPGSQLLVELGGSVLGLLDKAVSSPSALLRKRISIVLSRIKPASRAQVLSLIRLLGDKDPGVRRSTIDGLVALGPLAASETQKLLKSPDIQVRAASAEVLVRTGAKDKALFAILVEGAMAAECWERLRIVELIRALGEVVPQQLITSLLGCLAGLNDGDFASAVLDITARDLSLMTPAEAEGVRTGLMQMLRESDRHPALQVKIINRARQLELRTAEFVAELGRLLSSDKTNEAVRFAVLSALGSLGHESKGLVNALITLKDSSPDNQRLQSEIVLALSRIDPQAMDYRGYLINQLQEGQPQEAERLAVEFGASQGLPFLLNLFSSLTPNARLLLLRAIGDMGSAAFKAIPDLEQKLEGRDPDERYAALVSLLRIDPILAKAEPVLREELAGIRAPQLLDENLPKELVPVLESILAEPGSRLEKRNAQMLIEHLSK